MAYKAWLAMAEWDTRNFSFQVFAGNFNTLKTYCWETWCKHCDQYGIDNQFLNYEEMAQTFDINTRRVYAGLGLRDFNRIFEKENQT